MHARSSARELSPELTRCFYASACVYRRRLAPRQQARSFEVIFNKQGALKLQPVLSSTPFEKELVARGGAHY
jgi:hypothetical protein